MGAGLDQAVGSICIIGTEVTRAGCNWMAPGNHFFGKPGLLFEGPSQNEQIVHGMVGGGVLTIPLQLKNRALAASARRT